MQGFALATSLHSPSARARFPTKAQPSNLHTLATILTPLTKYSIISETLVNSLSPKIYSFDSKGTDFRQQAIAWANVDPDRCRHMASLGHSELIH